MDRSFDILVVGGGPAGLATAHAAAKAGASVLLVHRDPHIGLPIRTSGGSWLFHLRQLGIPDHLHHPIRSATFASPNVSATTPFTSDDHPVTLDVTATYVYLADLAREAGAEILTGARYVNTDQLSRNDFRSTVALGKNEFCVRSRFIVDASGSARAVTVPLRLQPRPTRYGVGAEYEYENLSPDPHHCLLLVGSRHFPSGYGWALPGPHGRIRVGVGVLQPDTRARPRPMLDDFMASDQPARLGLRTGRLIEKHFGVLPSEAPNRQAVFGNIVCVGDSAMQALPLIGEGIRYCIEAGRFAGNAIALAAHEPEAASKHLATYERWWRRRYAYQFWLAWKMNLRIASFTDHQWDMVSTVMQGLSPDAIARGLRSEIRPLELARFALRRPRLALMFGEALVGGALAR